MQHFLEQIKQSMDAELYYMALFGTLSLPDICGAILSKDGRAIKGRYTAWYNKYVYKRYNLLTAEECYNFRCSALHQGSSKPQKKQDYHRIMFIEPGSQIRANVKRIVTPNETAIMVDLRSFVDVVILGVEVWINEKQQDPDYQKNMKNFMHRYPNGYGQFVAGMPVYC